MNLEHLKAHATHLVINRNTYHNNKNSAPHARLFTTGKDMPFTE